MDYPAKLLLMVPQDNAYFIPSSLATLNGKGQIGIKIIVNNKVKFIPIEILSDTGNGFWINSNNIEKQNKLSIITQGQDFTVDGEKVIIIKKQ